MTAAVSMGQKASYGCSSSDSSRLCLSADDRNVIILFLLSSCTDRTD